MGKAPYFVPLPSWGPLQLLVKQVELLCTTPIYQQHGEFPVPKSEEVMVSLPLWSFWTWKLICYIYISFYIYMSIFYITIVPEWCRLYDFLSYWDIVQVSTAGASWPRIVRMNPKGPVDWPSFAKHWVPTVVAILPSWKMCRKTIHKRSIWHELNMYP